MLNISNMWPFKKKSKQSGLNDKSETKDSFQIKVDFSWFSDDYVCYKYTTDGKHWHTIQCAEKPILDDDYWKMEDLTHKISFSDNAFEYELKTKFSSLEKIQQYERIQQEICVQKNIEREQHKVELANKKRNLIDKINSKIN